MVSVSEICDALGRKHIEAELGVTKAAISNAVAEGVFPAAWYGVIFDMCATRGVECQRELFSFRRSSFSLVQGPDAA